MATIGIHIDRTRLRIAAADDSGAIAQFRDAVTPANLNKGLALLKKLTREAACGGSINAIGASCRGTVNAHEGIISLAHQPEWNGVPLRKIMEDEFHVPLRVEADVDASAVAEYRFGSVKPGRLLYLSLGVGLDCGFLVDGQIFRGSGGIRPQAGHQAIPYWLRKHTDPIRCTCGAVGCLEALVSGGGIQKLYKKRAENLTSKEWDEVGYNLGMGLRNLAVLYTPDLVVLGGETVARSGTSFLPMAEAIMRDGLRLVPHPSLVTSAFGDNASLFGAVALAQRI